MGRLLYELGRLNEKARIANERGSSKVGKGSFSWAWGLDGTAEERERYGLSTILMNGSVHHAEGSLWILLCNRWLRHTDKSQSSTLLVIKILSQT